MEPNDLPIMIECLVYRIVEKKYEFLCLKRTEEDGGWWQPVIGHMQKNESLEQSLFRELQEETGITKVEKLIDDVWHFHWEYKDEMYLEFVFAAEVNKDQEISLNPTEHEIYRWCLAEEAISLFKYENNKNALKKFREKFLQ